MIVALDWLIFYPLSISHSSSSLISSFSSLPPPPPYSSQPIFLLAVPCESGVCNGSTVTLQPQWDLLPEVGNTSHVTLFDLWEDVRAVK